MRERRGKLVGEIGSGWGILGMSGDMEVVDGGYDEKWSYVGFKVREEEGKL